MLANRIKHLRLSKNLNQVQLAKKLGVKKQSISNWENDNIVHSVEMLQKLADVFRVSTDYLLGREDCEKDGMSFIDVTGLTPSQVEHVRQIVDDIKRV